MYFDIFMMNGENVLPPLSDGRFLMSVAFVQDSTA